MRILSISDLHLGNGSKADDFVYYKSDQKLTTDSIFYTKLNNELKSCDMLVLNGDIYELWQQWNEAKIRKQYPKLTTLFENDSTVFIKGNHDHKLDKNTEFNISTEKFNIHFQHGHQNDPNMTGFWTILFNWIFGWVELKDPDFEDSFIGESDKKLYEDVERLVLDYFLKQNPDSYGIHLERVLGDQVIESNKKIKVLCLGHTHAPGIWKVLDKNKNIIGIYCNSGSCDHGKFDRLVIDETYITIKTDNNEDSIQIK